MVSKKKILLSIITTIPFLIGCGAKQDDTHCNVTISAGRGYFEDKTHETMSLSIKKGIMFYSVLTGIPDPTSSLDCYVFDHWEIDGEPVTKDFVIKTDITVVANYTYAAPIDITYDFNGGTYDGYATIKITNNYNVKWADAIKPFESEIKPKDSLEEFDCWSLNPLERQSISEIHSFKENVTLYALYRPKYLKLTALKMNSTISFVANASVDVSGLMYSRTGEEKDWHGWSDGSPIILKNVNDFVYFKNTNDTLSLNSQQFFRFVLEGSIAASGNTNSMINFSDIKTGCFASMFRNCINLYTAPSLPALVLKSRCYQDMFRNCINLLVAPDLPATTLGTHCYHSMFNGCIYLSTPPIDLPAKTLASHCYYCMFYTCESLIESPNILSDSVTTNSYAGMFSGCKSLSSIYLTYRGEFTSAFVSWVSGVNQEGYIYYLGYDMTSGKDAIPDGWEIAPKYKLIFNLKNCTTDAGNVNFHYGETVVVTISPNAGYKLPDEISCSAVGYDYDPRTGVIAFKGPSSVAYITVTAS